MFKFLAVLLTVFVVAPLSAQHAKVPVVEIGTLPGFLSGTSGLVYDEGYLWTVNDHSVLTLFKLDTATGEVVDRVNVSDGVPVDMEDLQMDSSAFYLGDIGNNCGCRTDLRILKVDRCSLFSGSPMVDTIVFFYPEQMLFSSDPFSTDFDCEAFVVDGDSIFLFTKQWSSLATACYAIPNMPGVHAAEFCYSLPVRGLVTGASVSESSGALLLVGYSKLMRPFLLRVFDWRNSGRVTFEKRFLSESMAQVEAVSQSPSGGAFATNEAFSLPLVVSISPRLLKLLWSE